MGQKLVIGPINKALRTDRTAFVIDNDNFPTMINAYQWRGRVKRKRGTQYLGQLERYFNSSSTAYSSTVSITLDGSGNGNLVSGFSLQTNSTIVPGSVIIVSSTPITYTDPTMDGYLTPTGTGGPNTINYSSGSILIPAAAGLSVSATFNYYPALPVLGIEDLVMTDSAFPGTIAFDTTYSYNVNTSFPYPVTDVSFYKNPSTSSYTGYTQKTTWTPTTWNGANYQQFWTFNYQGALWVSNGIDIPFTGNTIGMQFNRITGITITTAGNGTTVPAVCNITISSHGLVVGDFVFINEVQGITGINFQTGYITAVVNANIITVTFQNAIISGSYTSSSGIAQYLTSRSDPSVDCLRWYDGSPTNGTGSFYYGKGWVNFAPPLSQGSYTISDEPSSQYYLVGARIIIPFKDRLLFMGPVIQSSTGTPQYLQDTVIYSQNGTAYYTCSFNGSPLNPLNLDSILVPTDQTSTPTSYWEDQTGFGGFIQAGIDQPIVTAAFNEDVIVVGFKNLQSRLAYSGNDLIPFSFFSVNTEYGSSSTFSTITLDQGIMTRGDKGYVITSQTSCQRFDLDIPDQVFQINATDNGTERFCAYRDFINEWIYFTYPNNESFPGQFYPNETLQYNYRDNSWGIFQESYTTYGSFRKNTGFTWQTVGYQYSTWLEWNEPWNSGTNQLLNPLVLAGNQQGFLMIRGIGTGEGTSLFIQNISGNTVTSPDHTLYDNDYIIISGVIGTAGSQVNGEIFSVSIQDENTFILDPAVNISGYIGGGLITKMYVPNIQTKQFPVAWDLGRKTRIGTQMYLFTKTYNAQISLLIFLSQDSSDAYNNSAIVPDPASINNSLIYSTVLYTCPESTNLGLTPANSNLQMIVNPQTGNSGQQQIWHRINTSLIGDTVQFGFTISDVQMRDLESSGTYFSITSASQAYPCVLGCLGSFQAGQLILINGVVGMTQLNGNYYSVISSSSTTVTIDVDSSSFSTYVSGGTATLVSGINGFAEIEFHSAILDVNPSQILA